MGKCKPKKGRSAKAAQKNQMIQEHEDITKAPHTFVVTRGKVGRTMAQLKTDFKKVLEPYTATRLKTRRKNVVKDFVAVAGLLNVSHMALFTKTSLAPYVKLCKLPRGPTLTFRLHEFALNRDVVSSLKRPINYEKLFSHHPFLVLNNFSGDGMHIKLMATMFQNMFPSINVNSVSLDKVRRCVLFNYYPETKVVEFRHYAIKVVPQGISKGLKKLVKSKVPNLSRFDDISEFMTKSGMLSESEAEVDGPHNEVVLPQKMSSRGNMIAQKSAIRLMELGPRLTLKLIKIEDDLMKGNVLYHEFVTKTGTEKEANEKKSKKTRAKKKKPSIRDDNEKSGKVAKIRKGIKRSNPGQTRETSLKRTGGKTSAHKAKKMKLS